MAYITAEIKSPSLSRSVPVRLYFPTDLPASVGNKINGVITLLHGMGNTSADWMMYSAAPRYAADNGFVLIAPDASNSFYNDMACGAPFYTLLTQELPAQLAAIFNIPTERGKNYICGLSMGGYGALRIGLSQPQRFAAVGSFSGAVDLRPLAAMTKGVPVVGPMMDGIFGPERNFPDEADLFLLAEKAAALPEEQRPRILATCGRQDDDATNILDMNRAFAAHAQKLPLDFEYREWDGVHEWNFWDRSLAEFIGFATGSDYAERKKKDWSAT